MRITRKKCPLPFTYSINNNNISLVHSYKYLGVIITSDLRWNEHIEYTRKKAMKTLGYLRRTIGKTTKEIKMLAYKTYVRPILEYASAVWDPHTLANIKKLESVQRKSVRFIHNAYSRSTSPSALLESSNLETLERRRACERLKIFYQIYHNNLKIDRGKYIQPSQSRATRSHHSKKVKEFSCKTTTFQKSFFPRTVRSWNALPDEAASSTTVSSFMNSIANLPSIL